MSPLYSTGAVATALIITTFNIRIGSVVNEAWRSGTAADDYAVAGEASLTAGKTAEPFA